MGIFVSLHASDMFLSRNVLNKFSSAAFPGAGELSHDMDCLDVVS
jgi:hypothetical protein